MSLFGEFLSTILFLKWWGLAFIIIYLSSLWYAAKRQPERVMQLAVLGLYIIAGHNLHQIFITCHVLPHLHPLSYQAHFMISKSHLQLITSFALICSLLPIVLLAILLRPVGKPVRDPGCIPGAIMALLGVQIFQLIFHCFFIETIDLRVMQKEGDDQMQLNRQVQESSQIISQNKPDQTTGTPAPKQ